MCSRTCVALVAGLTAALALTAPLPREKDPATPFMKWVAKDEFGANDPHDPIVVKDRVIVGTDQGELRAYRCTDGEPVWTHNYGGRLFHRPSSDGRRVYFMSNRGLTAAVADDGTEAWATKLTFGDGPVLALRKPALVCVAGDDGTLYAVDAATGKQRWTADLLADALADPPGFPGERARLGGTKARPSGLAADGEAVFVSVFDQSRVVAFEANTGKRLWSFQAGGWVYGSAVATARHVFVGSQDSHFYCLDRQTGKKVWSYKTNGRIESGGAVDEKFVYIASCDGHVYCLSQADGTQRWKFAADRNEGDRRTAIYSVPVLRRDSVYFAAGEGQVYGLDRETGRLKGKLRPSEQSEMYCSLAADDALLFGVTRPRDRSKGRGEPSLVAIGLK
jgi:eukaryotic-like serine/threonine-protein kinase